MDIHFTLTRFVHRGELWGNKKLTIVPGSEIPGTAIKGQEMRQPEVPFCGTKRVFGVFVREISFKANTKPKSEHWWNH